MRHPIHLLLFAVLAALLVVHAHDDLEAREPHRSPRPHPLMTTCRVKGRRITCAKLCTKSQTWFNKHRKCVADYTGKCGCSAGGGGTTDEKTMNEQKVKDILSRRPDSDKKEIVFDGATVIEENDPSSPDLEAVGTQQVIDDLKFIQGAINASLPYQLSDIDVGGTQTRKRTVVPKQATRWKRDDIIRLAARKVVGNDITVTSGGKTVTMRKSQYAANMLYLASADWNKVNAPVKYYWTTNLNRATTIQELSGSDDATCRVRQYALSADKTQCVVSPSCNAATGTCCPPGGVVAYAELPFGQPAPGPAFQSTPVTKDPTYVHVCPLAFSNYLSGLRNALTHELGHNQGLDHEFGPEGNVSPLVPGDPNTARINGPTPNSIMSYDTNRIIQATDIAGLDAFYNQTGQQNGYFVRVIKIRGT